MAIVAQESPAGAVRRESLLVGDLNRDYLVYVPHGLPERDGTPVLFVFHGGGGEAKGTMNLSKFNSIADREKFIVVYPNGVGGNWNDGRATTFSRAHRENVDDLAFFDAMLDKLSSEHPIDGRRVFATGISNGGIFSHYLAANRSQKIAAIAPVVGGIAEPFDQMFKPSAAVSVLIIQGTDDPLVPYAGGKIAGRTAIDRGSVIDTDKAVRLWVQTNGCKDDPVIETLPDRDPNDGCRVKVNRWSDGKGGSEVWLYRVENGGHTWPGGAQYLPRGLIGRVTNDIDSQSIWEFLEAHSKAE
jgi:polyhydroxybutyrate depolymerase